MPYNPGVTDRSGEILAASLNQAGNNVAGAMQNIELLKAEKEMTLGKLNAYQQAGVLSPKDYEAAITGNRAKALGVLSQADARFALGQTNVRNQMDAANLQNEGDRIGIARDAQRIQQEQFMASKQYDAASSIPRKVDGGVVIPKTGQYASDPVPPPNGQMEQRLYDDSGQLVAIQQWNPSAGKYESAWKKGADNGLAGLLGGGAPAAPAVQTNAAPPPAAPPARTPAPALQPGALKRQNGRLWRFAGGNPNDPASWQLAQ
jgi:hypothetical protein